MKHIKMLGLAAFSAMALVALLGTASASASSFTSSEKEKALTTTVVTKEVFTITGSEVKCGHTSFEGTTQGTLENGLYHAASQRVHPVYTECEAFGFTSGVSISTKGCDYILYAATTPTTGKGEMANVEIVDHPGETCTGIVITADPPFTTCTAVVGKQLIPHAVSYSQVGTGTTAKVKVTSTATGISTNVTASNGLCPLSTGVHDGLEGRPEGGTYSGASEVSASGGVTYTP